MPVSRLSYLQNGATLVAKRLELKGIAMIGGLLSGGALTLYVIPAMYVLFSAADAAGESALGGRHLEPIEDEL